MSIRRLSLSLLFCGITLINAVAADPETAQVEIVFEVHVPEETPADAPVFIAGSFEGWNPGSDAHELSRDEAGVYSIALSFERGSAIQFKFTRGHWGVVEKGRAGEEIANRTLKVDEPMIHRFDVASWAGGANPKASSVSGNVARLELPGFLDGRRVWIYLPPEYGESPAENYPVLYMFDGQNVFDGATSFSGEWKVDESCERLIAGGEIRPVIVVVVANGESARIHEYTPWRERWGGRGGGGDEHLSHFIDVLIPYVNEHYRTMTGRQHTGVAGSSLGGLMALHAGFAYPETFGLIAALSPTLGWADERAMTLPSGVRERPVKLYLDMGTLENGTIQDKDGNDVDDNIDQLRRFRASCTEVGFQEGIDLLTFEDPDANHHESFWSARFPRALRFLFPPSEARSVTR